MIKDCGGLRLINGYYTRDANGLLEDAITRDFETVVILGFKDGNVHIQRSAMVSRFALLGAIEEAKHHILSGE
jgi:hypothetical protein